MTPQISRISAPVKFFLFLFGAGSLGVACAPSQTVNPSPTVVLEKAPLWPEEAYRQQQPAAAPVKSVLFPQVETFLLDNGVKVFLARKDWLPIVLMQFSFDMGLANDPPAKTGATSICMQLLQEGTKRLDKIAFEALQADKSITFYSGASTYNSYAIFTALKPQFAEATDLLAEMITTPGLRAVDFNRRKEQIKASLLSRKSNPSAMSRRLLDWFVWGANHPQGRFLTEESVDAISLADCKKIVGKLKPSGAKLFVAGNISKDEIRAQVQKSFSAWTGQAPQAKKDPKSAAKPGTIYFLHLPNSPQSIIKVALIGPARLAEDYAATYLMKQILGGSFSSRLNMNLREEKGIAYNSFANISYGKEESCIKAGASVQQNATAQGLDEMVKEFKRMSSSDASAAEIQREKEGAILSLPANFSNLFGLIGTAYDLDSHGLDMTWFDTFQLDLAKIDAQSIRLAAQKHLPADKYLALVVGDGRKVLPELRKLADTGIIGSGGLRIVDVYGQPTSPPPPAPKDSKP